MLQNLAEQIQRQQQTSQQMTQELMDTYMQLLNTPGSYLSEQAEQQQQTLQQTAQQWMEQAQQQAFQQMARKCSVTTRTYSTSRSLTPRKVCGRPGFLSKAMTNSPWRRILGASVASPWMSSGRCVIMRSAPRTETRSWSSSIAG